MSDLENATLETLDAAVRSRRRSLDQRQGEARSLALRGKGIQVEVAQLKAKIEIHGQVAVLLNTIGEQKQQQAQAQIESLVTAGLQAIFETNLSFHIVQKQSARGAQVEFVIRSRVDDLSMPEGTRNIDTELMDARGGGLVSVVGFLLRLVVALITRAVYPSKAGTLLVIDESFAMVSKEYIDRVADFLRQIVDKTGIQILMVTHQEELVEGADKVYRFSLNASGFTVVN